MTAAVSTLTHGFGTIPVGSSVGLIGDPSLTCRDERPRRVISALQKSKVSGLVLRESEASHRDGKQYGTGPGPRTGARSSGSRPTALIWDLTEQRKPRRAQREKTGLGRWLWKPAKEGAHHGTSPCARGSRGRKDQVPEKHEEGRPARGRSLGLRRLESSHQ